MLYQFLSRRQIGTAIVPMTDPPKGPLQPLRRKPVIGLALGAGAARGWAHIGVLRVFERAGYEVKVIAGTSSGAVAGGCFAAGRLDELEQFARSLTKRRVLGLMDFRIGAGLIGGRHLRHLLDRDVGNIPIEDLPIRFAAVATEIASGHEIWLTRGAMVPSLMASSAMPGVFVPVQVGGRWLFDGAVVNPVPITVARALGAEIVVAVNLNADFPGRGSVIHDHGAHPGEITPLSADDDHGWLGSPRRLAGRLRGLLENDHGRPSFGTVIVESCNITQDRIARSRLAADPPDIHIKPKLGKIGIFEFHRAAELIALGEEAAEAALPELETVIDQLSPLASAG